MSTIFLHHLKTVMCMCLCVHLPHRSRFRRRRAPGDEVPGCWGLDGHCHCAQNSSPVLWRSSACFYSLSHLLFKKL